MRQALLIQCQQEHIWWMGQWKARTKRLYATVKPGYSGIANYIQYIFTKHPNDLEKKVLYKFPHSRTQVCMFDVEIIVG